MKRTCLFALVPVLAFGARWAPIGPTGVDTTASFNGDLQAWHVGSIASFRGPAAAWRNPALLGFNAENAEFELFGSTEGESHAQVDEMGFFLRLGGLGFGMEHYESDLGGMGNRVAERYSIGSGATTGAFSVGYSYLWSKGNLDALKQPDQVKFGLAWQPNRWISLAGVATGVVGQAPTGPTGAEIYPDDILEAGIALRPLTRRLTLSLDGSWSMLDNEFIEGSDTYWAGIEAEPFDWLRLAARRNLDTEDMVAQVDLVWRGLSVGGVLPQANDDALDPGNRWHVYGSAAEFNHFHPVKPKPKLFARINLSGIGGEYNWLVVGTKFRMLEFLEQMDLAEKDPRVKGLLIQWQPGFQADAAMLHEIRRRIESYKEHTGGEVAFYSHSLGLGSLYLASVADRRAMLPIGEGEFGNFGGERLYYGDVLDVAGIDYIRFNRGAWKGAGEDLDSNHMSDEVRENVGRALTEIYDVMVEDTRRGYGFDEARMSDILSHWFVTKQDLLDFGLVDTLVYPDKVEDWVCRRAGDDDEDGDEDGKSISISIGFPNLLSFGGEGGDKKGNGEKVVSLRSLEIEKYARDWGQPDEIAVIYASGPIYDGRSVGPLLIGQETVVKQLEAARKDDRIKAVVFHIDSPGGSGYASDLIWHEMERLKKKKPLIVSQGFLAASGGYYLSMTADTILTTPLTITGSIGVAAGVFVDNGLAESASFRQDGVWAGKKESLGGAGILADLRVPAGHATLRLPTLPVMGRPLTESQHADLKGMIDDFYVDFVDKVAKGREMEWEEVDAIAEGRIWSGPTALELGLVDTMGGLGEAIELARRELGKDGKRAEIREIHPDLSLNDLLFLLFNGMSNLSLEQAKQDLFELKQADLEPGRVQLLGSGRPELLIDEEPLRLDLK